LVGRRRALDEMAPGDNDVVGAGEERHRSLGLVVRAEPRPFGFVHSPSHRPSADHSFDMGTAWLGRQIPIVVLARLATRLEPVVESPVVIGDDLEQVGDPPELSN
jgi:hypothetical protein